MVKPTVYSAEYVKKDDDLKKEKDPELPPLVKVVPDEVIGQSATAPPRRKGFWTPVRCCVLFTLLAIALVLLSLGVYILVYHLQSNTQFCGVSYDNDGDYGLEADVGIDPEHEYERIEQPENDQCQRITIMHDYSVQLSAYRLWSSNICYVKVLNQTTSLNPQEFWDKLRDPYFLNQHFQMLVESFLAVLPPLEHFGGLGLYIPILCEDVDTYWLERVSTNQMDNFMTEAQELMKETMEGLMSDDENQIDWMARKRRDTTQMLDDVINWTGKNVLDMQVLKPEITEALAKSGKLPFGKPSVEKAGKIAEKIAQSMPKHAMRMNARKY